MSANSYIIVGVALIVISIILAGVLEYLLFNFYKKNVSGERRKQ